MKSSQLFPRSTRPAHARKRVYAAIAATLVVGCLGAVWVHAALPSTDLSTWLDQMQASVSSTDISTSGQIQSGSSSISSSSSVSTGSAAIATSGSLSTQPAAACPGTVPCEPITPVVTAPCDPFSDLYGKNVVIVLDGPMTVWGKLISKCDGFLIIKHSENGQDTILRVSIQKILYVQSDA